MSGWKRGATLLTAAVLLAVALGGCVGGDEPPPSDPRAVDLRNATVDAIQDVDAYIYDLSGTVPVSQDDRVESINVSESGVVNVTQQQLRRSLLEDDDDNRLVYLDGETVYVPCPYSRAPAVEDAWYPARTMPDNRSWRAATHLGTGTVLERSRTYVAGNETIDGRQTHVIDVRPDVESWRSRQSSVVSPGPDDADRGRLENVTLRVWIDAETDRPVQLRITERWAAHGETVRTARTITFDYGSTPIPRPPTVDARDACPNVSE